MKRLVIMQGCSGSGKSFIAAAIAAANGGEIHSTDNYWMQDGKYCFNPALLEDNHKRNQEAVLDGMKRGVSCLIIDNTNIKREAAQVYLDMAKNHGYLVQVVRVDAEQELIKHQNGKRSSDRKIPEHVIQRQLNGLEKIL